MNIQYSTFLQLLSAHKNELGDVRSFLDECLPTPTKRELYLVNELLDSVAVLEITLDDGWVVEALQ